MVSFNRTGCRILQIFFEAPDLLLHVSVSRFLNLVSSDGTMPPDAQLVVRWLMSRPIGVTVHTWPENHSLQSGGTVYTSD